MNNKTLLDNLRCIPDFPKKGINFRDVTTLYKNPECMKVMMEELYDLYKDKGITKIVGIESRGFVMASALAVKLGAGVVLCRKEGKLPAEVVKESYSKEYGTDTIEIHKDAITQDDALKNILYNKNSENNGTNLKKYVKNINFDDSYCSFFIFTVTIFD